MEKARHNKSNERLWLEKIIKNTESGMDNNGEDKQGSMRYTTEATKLRDRGTPKRSTDE